LDYYNRQLIEVLAMAAGSLQQRSSKDISNGESLSHAEQHWSRLKCRSLESQSSFIRNFILSDLSKALKSGFHFSFPLQAQA
jgi:enoyl-[acyl-carrier-protein] reductase (NADH)